MFIKSKKRFAFPLICFAVLLLAFAIRPTPKLARTKALQFQSNNQLLAISKRMVIFKNEHGGVWPNKLDELAPNQRPDLTSIFVAPGKPKPSSAGDWGMTKGSIETWSDYEIRTNLDLEILAHEKPSLWKDGSVAVCYSNLHVVRLKKDDFLKALEGRHF